MPITSEFSLSSRALSVLVLFFVGVRRCASVIRAGCAHLSQQQFAHRPLQQRDDSHDE